MKTLKTKVLVIFLVVSTLPVLPLFAQSNDISAENKDTATLTPTVKQSAISGYAELNYYRHYLWRGALWGSNDVSQPELHLDYKNFSVAFYSNLNLVPKNLSPEFYKHRVVFDEQDVEIGYQDAFKKLEYEVLLSGYFYFNQLDAPNTGELCINLQYPIWEDIKIFTENAADIGAYTGAFYNSTGLLYEREINNLSIEARLFGGLANAEFNRVYYGANGTKVNFIGASLCLEYSLGHNFYAAATGEYNQYTSEEIKEVTGLKKTDNFSIHFGIAF